MNFGDLVGNAGLWWIVVALGLAGAELASPGVFLIFLAAGALLTGATVLAIPGLPILLQLVSFTLWSTVAVAIGRRWYHQFPVPTADALLNDRAGRLVGEMVTVVTPIEDGKGRVRVGDSDWPATGADAPVGTRMRIAAVRSGILMVEPLPPG